MKKLISLLLVICVLCPLLTGCVSKQEVSDTIKLKIIEDYLSWSGLKGNLSSEEVECIFLGQYGNSVAVYFKSAGAYDTSTEETVAKVKFTYPDSRVIRIWNDGKFYKMSDAYEQDLINKQHITKIYMESKSIVHGEPLFIWEEKTYCDYSKYEHPKYGLPDYLMSDRNLTIVVDSNISSPNKIFDDAFFENIGIASLYDDTEREIYYHPDEPYRQYLDVTLSEPSIENMKKVVAILESKDGIKKVEPHFVPQVGTAPNDTYYYDSTDYQGQWGLKNIEIDKVWDFTTGSSGVRVGIIDTGIASHEDLNNNYLDDNALDFRDVWQIQSIYGVKGDTGYHGTHLAGIIGGVGNNQKGIVGVTWKTQLTQLRVLNSNDTQISVKNAIDYAANTIFGENESKIRILNLSLQYWSKLNTDLESSIREYANRGGLLICIAGNRSFDLDINHTSEKIVELGSIYNSSPVENIITVGAIDYYNNLSSFSSWGANTVDIYAPGVEILSTVPVEYCTNNSTVVYSDLGEKRRCECEQVMYDWYYMTEHRNDGYHYEKGTSMAAPFVTGVAALLLSIDPDLTPIELKNCLIEGADDITIMVGDSNNEPQKVKKLNAWGAFKYLMNTYYDHEIVEIGDTIPFRSGTDTIERIDSYSTFKENTSFIKLDIQTVGNYTFNISSNENFKTVLYNSDFNVILEQSSSNSTVDFTRYLPAGTYYVKTNLVDSYEEFDDASISYSINYAPHLHSYTEWAKYTKTHHIECCECGLTGSVTEPHAVVATDLLFANCIHCGEFVNLKDTIVMVPPASANKVTLNGSYILPNGIIVLVDEDVEAYLNGTLVWYDKDNLPVTQ